MVKHRAKDERSSFYDALCAAEREAEENGRGIHNKTENHKHKINDCTGGVSSFILYNLINSLAQLRFIFEIIIDLCAKESALNYFYLK